MNKIIYVCLIGMIIEVETIQAQPNELSAGKRQAFHPDHKWEQDRQLPYSGRGFRNAFSGAPPIQFPSSGVTLLSWIPILDFGASMTTASTVEGYVSPSGREYALMGLSGGTGFVEVTNPSNPRIITVISGPTSSWRDIRTYQQYAYAVSEGGSGIQVIDLSNIDQDMVTHIVNITAGGSTSTHTVFVNSDSGFLYRCGGGSTNGLRMYSLENPASPTYLGTALSSRYIHECIVVTYPSGPYAGQEIAFCFTGSNRSLYILDVTDKSNIVTLSSIAYSNGAYSHQGWLSSDRQYLYLNDELDNLMRTRVFDISNLSAPVELPGFGDGTTAIDHNLYVRNNLLFESNYRSGLRIFDISDPTSPTPIGYFDTYPPDDLPNYNGLWDNDPYLPSGIILGSDIEKGLFVWWPGEPQLAFSYPKGLFNTIKPNGDRLIVDIDEQAGGVLQPGTARLHYDTGNGFSSVDLVRLYNGNYRALLPPTACGKIISYYVSAETSNGITWRDPPSAPDDIYMAEVGQVKVLVATDDMEAESGWSVGASGDNATGGIWTRVDPNGTTAQPENDHTTAGNTCWVTGQGSVGGPAGENDVDGGRTTLVSPILDLSSYDLPLISYWRWFSNNVSFPSVPNDRFKVEISNNAGGNWVFIEQVGPTGAEASGGWYQHLFLVNDFVTPTHQVQLRFIAEDIGSASTVEAGIDDLEVSELICFDCNHNLIEDAEDIANETSQDTDQDGIPDECRRIFPIPVGSKDNIDPVDVIPIIPP